MHVNVLTVSALYRLCLRQERIELVLFALSSLISSHPRVKLSCAKVSGGTSMTEYKCYIHDYFSPRVDFIFLDTNSVIKNVFAVFQHYGKYSKQGLAKVLESELHGNLEDCLMTLGKETFILVCECLWVCEGDSRHVKCCDRKTIQSKAFKKLVFPALRVEGWSSQHYHTNLYPTKICTKIQ